MIVTNCHLTVVVMTQWRVRTQACHFSSIIYRLQNVLLAARDGARAGVVVLVRLVGASDLPESFCEVDVLRWSSAKVEVLT